jgi:hypothetical protein
MDYSNIKILLFLGPYRNLTTMVGAHLNFHENVIVYNHGYYGFLDNKANFWNKKTDESLNNFVSFVMENYQQGHRGRKGGSILFSHAYDKRNNLYGHRDKIPKKNDIKYIVWKDSGRLMKSVRNSWDDYKTIENLLDVFKGRLYFIRPVRHIYKCVMSNLHYGNFETHDLFHPEKSDKTTEETLLEWCVLDLNWFYTLAHKYPKHFIYIFEDDMDDFNKIMTKFLNLPLTKTLVDVKMSDTRQITPERMEYYGKLIKSLCKNKKINSNLYEELKKRI